MLLLLLAVLSITAHAVIPAGFMPDASRVSGTFIKICSGFSEKTVYMPDESDAPATHDQGSEVCNFATLAMVAQPDPALPPVFVMAQSTPIKPVVSYAYIYAAHLAEANPSTGPPTLL